MNCLAEQRTSQFGGTLAAPRVTIIFAISPPGHIDVKDKRFAGQLLVDQVFEFLQAMTKSILKDRHHLATAFTSQTRNLIHLSKTPNEWFFTNHVFARLERRLNLAQMKSWRCTNIDYVDIGSAADLVKILGYFLDVVFCGDRGRSVEIEVANYLYFEKVWEFLKTFDVRNTNSGSDDRDSKRKIHGRENLD
jgi:hypothetical protein